MKNSAFKEDFDLLHDINPGKHFYQFYKDPNDLLKALAPYWEAGVQKGNYCFWIAPVYMTVREAKAALTEIPHIEEAFQKGSFEIVSHEDWYGDGETFDGDLVLNKFTIKLKEVVSRGFSIMRCAGDAFGFKQHLWSALQEYERKGQSQIHEFPCIALCSYPIHMLRLQQTRDVLDNHHGVLVAHV